MRVNRPDDPQRCSSQRDPLQVDRACGFPSRPAALPDIKKAEFLVDESLATMQSVETRIARRAGTWKWPREKRTSPSGNVYLHLKVFAHGYSQAGLSSRHRDFLAWP
jgi:hypothetical protein